MSHSVGPAILPLGRPRRTIDSRPVPSGAPGSPPTGPRLAPRRLGTLLTPMVVNGDNCDEGGGV